MFKIKKMSAKREETLWERPIENVLQVVEDDFIGKAEAQEKEECFFFCNVKGENRHVWLVDGAICYSRIPRTIFDKSSLKDRLEGKINFYTIYEVVFRDREIAIYVQSLGSDDFRKVSVSFFNEKLAEEFFNLLKEVISSKCQDLRVVKDDFEMPDGKNLFSAEGIDYDCGFSKINASVQITSVQLSCGLRLFLKEKTLYLKNGKSVRSLPIYALSEARYEDQKLFLSFKGRRTLKYSVGSKEEKNAVSFCVDIYATLLSADEA